MSAVVAQMRKKNKKNSPNTIVPTLLSGGYTPPHTALSLDPIKFSNSAKVARHVTGNPDKPEQNIWWKQCPHIDRIGPVRSRFRTIPVELSRRPAHCWIVLMSSRHRQPKMNEADAITGTREWRQYQVLGKNVTVQYDEHVDLSL